MDSFRNNRHNHRKAGSLDGFLNAPSPRAKQSSKTTLGQIHGQSKVGNFRSTDGFYATSRDSIRPNISSVGRNPRRDDTGRIALDLPIAEPHRRKKSKRWAKAAFKTFGVLIIISVLLGGALFGKGLLKARQIFKGGGGAAALQSNVDPSLLRGEGDGRINILMLGKGGFGHEGADLTDTIVIASIDPIQKEAALLSIPRDFYVKVGSSYTKINAVYSNAKQQMYAKTSTKDSKRDEKAENAGLQAIEDTIQTTIGIPIHYHVMVDFTGFKEAIDTVGGVDLNVPKELAVTEQMYIEGHGNYYLNVPSGQQHFDGFRALAFARTRHTSPRGDFDRSERQRLILIALKSKVLSAGTYGNPLKINQLINAFGNHIQANMTSDEMLRLYNLGKQIDSSKVVSLGLADPPNNYVTTANIDGLSVVIPRAGIGDYKEIQNFIRNRLKDSFLQNENASVIVLNGTNVPGLATRTADDLKSFGYNVNQIADAPTKGYGQTIVVDLRNGSKKYTRHYLETRFSVGAVNSLPDKSIVPGNADFVIILGQNEVNRLDN